MNFLRESHVALGMIFCAVIVIMANVYPRSRSYGLESMTIQDVSSLDRRISLLEQRFYSLESSLNRLQQLTVAQGSAASQIRSRDIEINQLREEIQKLSLRINEIECGLVKLDERTAVSDRTRKSDAAKTGDPCRSNPGSPVRLSNRP
jgi:vacuolar-type H+-ATPase subunit I/STV1